jgi:hypothetical protein
MPELEKKKKELTEKRQLYKPLDKKEFAEFEQEYKERKKETDDKYK